MDPLAEVHYGYNPYNYVLNNPMLYMDPLGLDTMGYHGLTEDKWRGFNTGQGLVELNVVTIGYGRRCREEDYRGKDSLIGLDKYVCRNMHVFMQFSNHFYRQLSFFVEDLTCTAF